MEMSLLCDEGHASPPSRRSARFGSLAATLMLAVLACAAQGCSGRVVSDGVAPENGADTDTSDEGADSIDPDGIDAGLSPAKPAKKDAGGLATRDASPASTSGRDAAREGGSKTQPGAGDDGGSGAPASGSDATMTPAVPAGAVTFTKNIRLNDDTGKGKQYEVTMAAGPDGLVLAGWVDERATRVCGFSFSTDGGQSWSKNVSISNSGGQFVGDPAVAIDGGGTMYAICQQYIVSGSSGAIRLMTSSDKGATWSAVTTIQSAIDKPWAGGGVQDGTVFVSWLGNPGGIKRSTDHGKTWGPVQTLGNLIHGTAINTSTSGFVHVPYNADSDRNQLRYLRSKDSGETWEAKRDLVADMGTFCFNCKPRQHPIVGQGSDPTGKYVAITWASTMTGGEGDDDVWLIYSKDSGETWTKPVRVSDNKTKSRQFESWVAVDNYGRVHVAWTDYRNSGQNETWYARSEDPSKGFEPNIQVTDGRGTGSSDFLGDYKGIVVQGADVLIVWQDTRNDSGDIYFARAAGAAGAPP